MRSSQDIRDAEHRALASGQNGGLANTYLVEAGAGTGKTTVLVDRLLALLRAGTSISRIVAITFTEKAAGELKVRLRGELETAAREAETEEERDVLTTALHEIDRAHVGTIHGFCSNLIKERPVEACVDPNFGVADELQRTVILESTWDSWLREQFSDDLPRSVVEAQALGHGLSRIQELALRLIGYRDLLDLVPEPVDTGDVEQLAADFATEARAFEELAKTECTDSSDSAVAAIGKFTRQVEMLAYLPEETRTSFILRHVQPQPGRNNGRKGNWSDGVLADIKARVAELRARRDELRGHFSHSAAVELVGWLRGFVRAYEDEKTRLGVLDFQDLLEKARDLIKGNLEVREHFKRAYDRVLLDEFQDTDPLQCEIAFFLCEKAGGKATDWRKVELQPGKLFLVGDPKQSIYKFRRADIETYEQAKAQVRRAGEVLELVENFRTRPEIVDSVNAVFSTIMRRPEDGRGYQPEYADLTAHRPRAAEGPGVILLPPPAPLDKAPVDQIREAEARSVAAFLAHARDTGRLRVFDRDESDWRPVELRDIAVLFHSTLALDAYESAFGDYGLDYRIAGGKKFYARREVKELATVLAAVEDPHDLVSVVGALRTPFFGVSDEAIVLHRLETGSLNYLSHKPGGIADVNDSMALLRELHSQRNSLGAAKLINELFERTNILELFLMKPSGEQRHANLMKVAELADGLTKKNAFSFGGFVRWLRDVQQLTPEEAESPLSEEGDDFVRMLTIHKAKGLEFPVTVLADLGRRRGHTENMVFDRVEERMEFGFGPEGDRLETLGYEELKELEKLRQAAEVIRLLYVGATRARDAVVIPWFAGGKGAGKSPPLSLIGSLAEAAGAPVTDLAAVRGSPGPVAFDTSVLDLSLTHRKPTRLKIEEARGIDPAGTAAVRERDKWRAWLAHFKDEHNAPREIFTPSGAEPKTVPAALDGRDDGLPPLPDGVSGREIGTLVHSVMEVIDFGAAASATSIAGTIARSTGLPEEAVPLAAGIVERGLASPVMGRASAAARSWREVPICLVHGGGTLMGKMDLVFEEEDGVVVVDYKTDSLGPNGARELGEHYRGQAEAYAVALASVIDHPVKEVVLLFMRAPDSPVSFSVDMDGESVDKRLSALFAAGE